MGVCGALRPSYAPRLRLPSTSRIRQSTHRAMATSVVHESLTLLALDGVDAEAQAEAVDKLWSMQYVVPGPVCGCAGKLVPLSAAGSAPPPPASHAVLFRFPQFATQERFLNHLKVKEVIASGASLAHKDAMTLWFEGSVPNELEAIFRKGPEWEVGHELIIALAPQPGVPPEDGEEFLELTQQLATSSAYGAVQASFGACRDVTVVPPAVEAGSSGGGESDAGDKGKPEMVLLVRFQSREQLEGFVCCPPVAAMLEGDDLSPLRAVWAGALVIEPSDTSAKPPPTGVLM